MFANKKLILSCVALMFAACAGEISKIVPVSGIVTLDGKPLANANVQFQPMAQGNENPGYGSFAVTDQSGKFELAISSQQLQKQGAVVGKHRVSITSGQDKIEYDPKVGSPDGSTPKTRVKPERVPEKYNTQTTLIFEVPLAGTNMANFDLQSK